MIQAVLPTLRADPRADVTVVASGAAFDSLAASDEAPQRFALPDGRTHIPIGSDCEPLLRATHELLARIQPDIIAVGISSLGVGLDEGLLACAGRRPTFALQDYPGDANAIDGKFADLYLVRDEPAALLTRARHGVVALAVGSIRHAAYAALDIQGLRSRARAELQAGDRAIVGFFGQPAEIPGQEQGLRDLVSALAHRSPTPLVLLREHPKSPELRTAHRATFVAAGLPVHDTTGVQPIEPWLAACDVVATGFSHCAMDYAFLSAASPEPLGASLFLLTTDEARTFLRASSGDELPDGVARGLGVVARTPAEVSRALDFLFSYEGRHGYHEASRRLPRGADMARIVEILLTGPPASTLAR
jgi:hypothetical protein